LAVVSPDSEEGKEDIETWNSQAIVTIAGGYAVVLFSDSHTPHPAYPLEVRMRGKYKFLVWLGVLSRT
jgi:hypothetical protein